MSDDDGTTLFVQVNGKDRRNEICSALRGLFHAGRQSDGHSKKNAAFVQGVEVEFGAAISLVMFLESVDALFRKRIRRRIKLERRP